jgi:hypothetical protein
MKTARSRLSQLQKAAAAAPVPTTPIAQARLEKLQKEIALLEHKVRSADLERRALEGELMYQSEAAELLVAGIAPVSDGLRSLPKALAPRLVGQPQREDRGHADRVRQPTPQTWSTRHPDFQGKDRFPRIMTPTEHEREALPPSPPRKCALRGCGDCRPD